MKEDNPIKKLEEIVESDKRYGLEAYIFVLEALHFTVFKLKRQGHLSGEELLEGIKEYAINQYGKMARTVFEHWGVKETQDFGNIVFTMVDNELLGKTEQDSIDDFKNRYNFKEVFEDKFNL
ncbi:MAG: Minf_1886 family protein [Candidatus Omnitrophota bacterium]